MHFSVPFVEEVADENGKKFQVYKVYVNGVHYCTPRYSQLLQLYESLKQDVTSKDRDFQMPPFPPKRLLQLTSSQIEERRQLLEKFFQDVGSNSKLFSHPIFAEFLSSSHEAMMDIDTHKVQLSVFLMSGNQLTLPVNNNARTPTVLQLVTSHLRLDPQLVNYFALFLVRCDSSNDLIVVRPLQTFEAPFLSLQDAEKSNGTAHRILLRKSFWSPLEEEELMSDPVALDLVFSQALAEVDRGWVDLPPQKDPRAQQLDRLRQKQSKREFVQLCRTLHFYNYLHVKSCFVRSAIADGGQAALVSVAVAVGPDEIVITSPAQQRMSLNVVRIKTWRVTTVCHRQPPADTADATDDNRQHELALEHFTEDEKMQWIHIYSAKAEQVILLSMALQSVVNEILRRRRGISLKLPKSETTPSSVTPVPAARRKSSLQVAMIGDADL